MSRNEWEIGVNATACQRPSHKQEAVCRFNDWKDVRGKPVPLLLLHKGRYISLFHKPLQNFAVTLNGEII